jgi:hypothetical protein
MPDAANDIIQHWSDPQGIKSRWMEDRGPRPMNHLKTTIAYGGKKAEYPNNLTQNVLSSSPFPHFLAIIFSLTEFKFLFSPFTFLQTWVKKL